MTFGMPSTLRRQIQLLVGVLLLPVVVLIVVSEYVARDREIRRARDEAYRMARAASAAHLRLARATDAVLTAVMRLPSISNGDAAQCTKDLLQILERFPTLQNIG